MCRYIRLNGSQSSKCYVPIHSEQRNIMGTLQSSERLKALGPLMALVSRSIGVEGGCRGIEVSGPGTQHSNSPSCVRIGRRSHAALSSANMFHSLSVSHHTLGVTLTVFLLFVAHVSVVFTYYSPLVI